MENATDETSHRVLALLWHAPHEVIAAGGFRRTYEIFKRVPDEVEVVALDDQPTFLGGLDPERVKVLEYRIPTPIRRLERRFFWLERALEWMMTAIILTFRCAVMRLRGERYETVFVPSSEQIPALVAGIAAKYIFGAPLVVCNLNIDIFPERYRTRLAELHNSADQVIAISDHLAEELKRYGVSSPILVNGVGLDTDEVPEPGAFEFDEKVFDAVFVGRHDAEKGIFDLIRIWRIVAARKPDARLVMIGSCNPNNQMRLQTLIDMYELHDNVVIKGTVTDDEKYSLIMSSRLCAFPSFVEEWGLVPQEALACGLPVVLYDLPVYRENISECGAVFRMPTGDLKGMADKITELLANERYRDYNCIGPDFVERFGWDVIAEREFDILLGSQRAPASLAPDDQAGA